MKSQSKLLISTFIGIDTNHLLTPIYNYPPYRILVDNSRTPFSKEDEKKQNIPPEECLVSKLVHQIPGQDASNSNAVLSQLRVKQ